MPTKKLKKYSLIVLFAILMLSSPLLILRIIYETKNKTVEICVNYQQIENLAEKYNYPIENLLERLKTIGVTSIILLEESFDSLMNSDRHITFTPQEVEKLRLLDIISPSSAIRPYTIFIKDYNSAKHIASIIEYKTNKKIYIHPIAGYTVLRLDPVKHQLKYIGLGLDIRKFNLITKLGLDIVPVLHSISDPEYIFKFYPKNISTILFNQESEIKLTDLKKFITTLSIHRMKFPVFEFENYNGYRSEFYTFRDIILPGHRIGNNDELKKYTSTSLNRRYLKAIKERGCRFLIYDFFEILNIEENLNNLHNFTKQLKKSGFNLGTAKIYESSLSFSPFVIQLLITLFALFIPVLSFLIFVRNKKINNTKQALVTFIKISLVNIMAGIIISAIFFLNIAYPLKIVEFVGPRIIFILPLIILTFFFIPLKKIFNLQINIKHIIITVFLIVVLARFDLLKPHPYEHKIRTILEETFLMRIRFKEFLFGHPLLISGLCLNSPTLTVIGYIGQVSIINTFLHPHISISTSLVRTIIGILLGIVNGVILTFLILSFRTRSMYKVAKVKFQKFS